MKKIIKLSIFIICFMLFSAYVKAGSYSISADKRTVNVGDTVSITVGINNLAGSFSISSSNNGVLAGGKSDWFESSTTVYFTAKSAGSAVITVTASDVADYDTGNAVGGSKSITINVVEPSRGNRSSSSNSTKKNKQSYDYSDDTIDINKEYSSDNYLSSLNIEGYDIDFDKEKHEYSLDVDEDTTSINITATAVVAENGNERVYTITVNVKDTDPIKVKIGKKKYTVVKKVEQLTAPDNFSPIEADIDGKKVPALYNEITGYILVGLKDKKGNIKLYIYNPKTDKYTIYNEITFNSIKLYYSKPDRVPLGLKKTTIDINGEKVVAYKNSKKSDFYLVYGMNVNTGDIGWYRYDASDKTLQRYETRDLENLSMLNNKYLITIAVLSTSILMLMLFLLILFSRLKHMK